MGKLFDFEFLLEAFPKILSFLPVTIEITLVAMLIGLAIGLVIAMAKIYHIPVLEQLGSGYVAFIRGTPLMVLIYLTYFGIPLLLEAVNRSFGTTINTNGIPAIAFAFVALGLNDGAFNSETIRSAIQSVDKGQIEAGYAMGMTPFQAFKRIILPEALIVAIPNLGNHFIGLTKATSLAFTVSVVDIMAAAKIQGARGMRYVEVFIDVAIIYWVLCFILAKVVIVIEKKLKASERGMSA